MSVRRNERPRAAFVSVTLNPAIDRTMEVDELRLGEVVRGRLLLHEPAGKGVNVALDLAALGHDVRATGFVGRHESALFRSGLAAMGVRMDFVLVTGRTRESLTILDRKRDQETHLTEQGFEVSPRNVASLIRKTTDAAGAGTWVVAVGRPGPGFDVGDYARLLERAKAAGAQVAADTSGRFLPAAVELAPDFIKPNDEELSELVGRPLRSEAAVLRAAKDLAARIRYVVVSLGPKGALCVTRRGAWHAKERGRVKVAHTVGCGDAVASGFVAGIPEGRRPPEALRLAVACGGACARTLLAALRSREEAEAVLPRVEVRRVRGSSVSVRVGPC